MLSKKNYSCPSCNSSHLLLFYEALNVPINSCILFSNYEEAINYPSGNVILGFCDNCGFISNVAFDSQKIDYSTLAPEEQRSSATFNLFANRLAKRLIDNYNICGKNVLEIGCGRGDFLALLCELGNNKGVGIDPSTITGELNPLPHLSLIHI